MSWKGGQLGNVIGAEAALIKLENYPAGTGECRVHA
ncbi:MAG: hypothetical protein JWQ71_4110 [Pedosphaera sp.]|nr:hypothetical protein [Pedosphaera sp.]